MTATLRTMISTVVRITASMMLRTIVKTMLLLMMIPRIKYGKYNDHDQHENADLNENRDP